MGTRANQRATKEAIIGTMVSPVPRSVLLNINIKARESNQIEVAVYGVAIEAEMQGFIYGFKLYEELMNRSVVA